MSEESSEELPAIPESAYIRHFRHSVKIYKYGCWLFAGILLGRTLGLVFESTPSDQQFTSWGILPISIVGFVMCAIFGWLARRSLNKAVEAEISWTKRQAERNAHSK